MEQRFYKVRGTNGEVFTFDDYEHTVTDQNGRKLDFIEHDPANIAQRDFSVANVHTATALSNFAIDYGSNTDGAIADMVAPPILVTKASDYYYTYSENNRFRRVNALLASEESSIDEVGPEISTSTYTTKPYGLATFIAQGVEANADAGVNPRMRAMARVMSALTTDREHRCAAQALDGTTNFASYKTTLTSSNYWDDGADSDPRKDIIGAIESALLPINGMALSEKSWHRFCHNEQTAKYGLAVGQAVNESPAALMARLGFPGVVPLIGKMKSESITAGTTTKSYVWDDDCLFLHLPSGNAIEDAPTLRTFRWLKDGMSRESGGWRIREWEVPDRGQDGGRKIAVVVNEVIVATAPATGYLYENVW